MLFLSFFYVKSYSEIGREIFDGIYLGGYASVDYIHKEDNDILAVDELAAIFYGEFDRFDFLGEFENEGLYKRVFGSLDSETVQKTIHIERAYITYYFDNGDYLRVGKFNSKIGFWNQMPINVLRPTTSSPYLVNRMFPKFTSGFLYTKEINNNYFKNISFTLQNNNDIDGDYNNFDLNRHYAVSLDMNHWDTSFRFGGGYFRYKNNFDNRYLFASFKTQGDIFDWLGEFAIRIKSDDVYMHDFYLQNIWHFKDKEDFVSRIEHYEDENFYFSEFVYVGGVVYRPKSNVALKAEFEAHTYLSNRFLFSFSVMF